VRGTGRLEGLQVRSRTSQCPADQGRCGDVTITLSHLDLAVKDGSGRQVDTCSTGRLPVGWEVKVVWRRFGALRVRSLTYRFPSL
jgi:hypothetical protein